VTPVALQTLRIPRHRARNAAAQNTVDPFGQAGAVDYVMMGSDGLRVTDNRLIRKIEDA
jgi:hypothetical protein